MVVLKKIKSATLVEALVATILIVIIFVIASLVLNNLVLNTLSKNTHQIEYRLNELEYDLQNHVIKIPYEEEYEDWDIIIQKEKIQSNEWLSIVANNTKTNKEVIRKRIHE
jgi:predicted PurR-regulated permease PerM